MRRALTLAWLLAFWGISPAVRLLAASDPAETKHEYRISGVVVSSRDGAPVAHCQVEVLPEAQDAPGQRRSRFGDAEERGGQGGVFADRAAAATAMQETTTDARGQFTIAVAHAGLWRLRASGRGFRLQGYDQHRNFSSMIALTEAAPAASVTFRLAPEAVIRGSVFDEAGEAVRMAQVRLELLRARMPDESFRGGQVTGTTQTDDRGRYELSGLGPGDYRLMVQVSPWYSTLSHPQSNVGEVSTLDPSLDVVYPNLWYPGVTEKASAGVLHLDGGEEQEADFNLVPTASIHLKVPQQQVTPDTHERRTQQQFPSISNALDGQPNPNQVVRLQDKTWEVGGLAPGVYQVRVPGTTGEPERLLDLKIAAGSSSVLGLESAVEEVSVTVALTGGPGTGRGNVTFVNPDTGQSYSATGGRRQAGGPRNGPAPPDGAEDQEQSRRMAHMPPHRYVIRMAGTQDAYVTGVTATGARLSGRMIEISGGAPVVTIAMAIGRAEVTGVARLGGKVSAGAMVLLVPATYGVAGGDPAMQAETNTDGSFKLQAVVPGPYILVALDHGWSVHWDDPATLAPYLLAGVPLDLKPGATSKQDIEAVAP